jgi:hypothetical protein
MEQHGLSVVLFSANNPDATYLTAGLLRGQVSVVRQITLQNVDTPHPSPQVLRALREDGIDIAAWQPDIIPADTVQHVNVGITLCVPT